MLKNFIKQSCIQINVEASGWEDAIKKSSAPLVNERLIDKSYVNSIINTVKEYGPYFIIAKGIALPHAANTDNVYENSMSITTLKNPVEFGHEFNDPVKLVFVLAAKNSTDHLDSLSELVELLSDDGFVHTLHTCDNSKDVYNYINEKMGCK